MILEAARNQVDTVGEQGRGQGVAGVALEAPSVEGEAEGSRSIDAAALGQAKWLRPHPPSSFASGRLPEPIWGSPQGVGAARELISGADSLMP